MVVRSRRFAAERRVARARVVGAGARSAVRARRRRRRGRRRVAKRRRAALWIVRAVFGQRIVGGWARVEIRRRRRRRRRSAAGRRAVMQMVMMLMAGGVRVGTGAKREQPRRRARRRQRHVTMLLVVVMMRRRRLMRVHLVQIVRTRLGAHVLAGPVAAQILVEGGRIGDVRGARVRRQAGGQRR